MEIESSIPEYLGIHNRALGSRRLSGGASPPLPLFLKGAFTLSASQISILIMM